MNAILDTTKLQEAHRAKLAKMQAMNALVIETGETFTAEQQSEYDTLNASVTALDKQIEVINQANERVAGLLNIGENNSNNQAAGVVNQGNGSTTNNASNNGFGQSSSTLNEGTIVQRAGNSSQLPGNNPRIRVGEPGFVNDPKCGFRDMHEYLENVMRYGETVTGRRSGFKDERIDYLSSRNVAIRTGFLNDCSDGNCDPGGSTTDLTGSVFVPIEFAPEVFKTDMVVPEGAFRTTRKASRAMQVTKKYRLDKDHRQSVTGGFKVGRNFEHCCNVSSASRHTEYTVNLNPLYGAYCASDVLLETNPQMIIQDVEEGFRTEFAVQRLVEILNGQAQGEYHGIWNSPALIKVTPKNGNPTADIAKEDIYNISARLWRGLSRESIVWIAGLNWQTTLKMLQDTNLSSVAYFLFDPNGGPDWADGMLDGYPIVFTELVPGLTYRGGLGLYNMGEYEEYTWRPLRMASSMHARFVCNETVMKFWTYTGGTPRWASTLIPKCVPSGEDVADHTLSPFVVLDGSTSDCPEPSRVHGKKAPAASSSSSS